MYKNDDSIHIRNEFRWTTLSRSLLMLKGRIGAFECRLVVIKFNIVTLRVAVSQSKMAENGEGIFFRICFYCIFLGFSVLVCLWKRQMSVFGHWLLVLVVGWQTIVDPEEVASYWCRLLSAGDCWLTGVVVGCWLHIVGVDCRSLFPERISVPLTSLYPAYNESKTPIVSA